MAIELNITSIEDAGANVRPFVEEREGKFYLNDDKIDPAEELKTALSKEREESKKYKSRAKELESAQTEAEQKRAKEKGEFESLYNSTQTELEAERKANTDYRLNIQKKDISNAALKLAATLTKDVDRAELLQEKVAGLSRYTDEGIKFELGGIEVDSTKVVSHLTEKYPFLVDGSQSSGGGANGGKDSGGAAKTMSRSEFESLNANDRMKFTKGGGTLTE